VAKFGINESGFVTLDDRPATESEILAAIDLERAECERLRAENEELRANPPVVIVLDRTKLDAAAIVLCEARNEELSEHDEPYKPEHCRTALVRALRSLVNNVLEAPIRYAYQRPSYSSVLYSATLIGFDDMIANARHDERKAVSE
jgi:hypothetical protein